MPGYQLPSVYPYVDLPSTTTGIFAADLNKTVLAIQNIDCTFLPCRVATTAAITLSGLQTVDGVSLNAGDRVLNKDDTTPVNRGIWVVGSGSWARAGDMASGIIMKSGSTVLVTAGAASSGVIYTIFGPISSSSTATVGTDNLTIRATGALVQNNGSPMTRRPALNFINGLTATDNPTNSSTDIGAATGFQVKATNPSGGQLFLSGLADSPMDGVTLLNGDLVYYRHDGVPGDSGIYVVNSTGSWTRWLGMSLGMTFPSGLHIRILQGTTKGGVTYITWPHSGASNYTISTFPSGEIIDIDEIPSPVQVTLSSVNAGAGVIVQPARDTYQRVLLTRNTVVAFAETPDNLDREFSLLIEQDATGGHQIIWSPQTIGWSNGVQPIIDTAPGSVTLVRGRWLGTNYGMVAESFVGVGQYMRTIPDPWKGVTIGFPAYIMRRMSSASIDNIVNTLNRWTTTAHRQLIGTNGGYIQFSDWYDTDGPGAAGFRGGIWEFQGGFDFGPAFVGTSPLAFSDATIHEYFHVEHNYLFPSGYTDPGGGAYAAYTTAVPAIGYTVPITLLNHPVVQDCWIRAYNATATRTVTGCATTSGSTTVTTTSSFVVPSSTGAPNADESLDQNGNPYVLAGVSGAGIPAPSRTVSNCVTYSTFNIITFPSGQITTSDVGAQITGTGIPSGTGIVSVDTTNNRAVISHLATAGGTFTATITDQTRVQTVNSTTQVTLSAAASATASGVTLTITYPVGNNSALAEWWSQMRTAKHANSDGVLNTEQGVAGGLSSVVTDFENFITHLAIPGG